MDGAEDLYAVGAGAPVVEAMGPPGTPRERARSDSETLGLIPASPNAAAAAGSSAPAMIAPGAPRIVKEKIPAARDSNTATAQTVAKMCEYIHAGINDEVCRSWATRALQFAPGSRDASACCWGVYWLIKHLVKYVRDEPRLFSVGEAAALDLLTAPAVLVRMPQPKEDCDGFTMLVCTLLRILGVQCYIVTVAADPSDPSRWSHVFALAELGDGRTCPMDCSHGNAPGWMIPRAHIFRWQAWDMNGRAADVPIPNYGRLNGYVRRGSSMRRGVSGLGQDVTTDAGGDTTVSIPTFGDTTPVIEPVVTSSPASTGTPINWGSIINTAISGAANVAKLAFLPPGTVVSTSPGGGSYVATAGGPGSSLLAPGAAGIGSLLPWLLIGGVVIFAMSAMERK